MVKTDVTFTATVKSHVSGFFAASAALFARQAKAIERTHDLTAPEDVRMHHRSYSIGAIVSAAGFLEAAINELYLSAVDGNPNVIPNKQDREVLGAVWADLDGQGRATVLTKYDLALALTGRERFDRGANPFQDADNLVTLRNALVHYKPEWSNALDKHQRLADRLRGKFPENVLIQQHPSIEFFPHRCLGHGCAQWAVQSALRLYEGFSERMGLVRRELVHPASLLETE